MAPKRKPSGGGGNFSLLVSLLIIIVAGVLYGGGGQSLTSSNSAGAGITWPWNGTSAGTTSTGSGAGSGTSSGAAQSGGSSSAPATEPASGPSAPSPQETTPGNTELDVTDPNNAEAEPESDAQVKKTILIALDRITVATPSTVAYDRSYFKHWIDADKDGCNTRAEVLLAETLKPTTVSSGCTIATGKWYSPYDDITITDASALDIDHMVPLKEAWVSGAYRWTAAQREAFANDLSAPYSLIAVSASSNRSKSDRDPAAWMPSNISYRCTYAASWVKVKAQWNLTMDVTEKTYLTQVLGSCTDASIALPTK
jgi:hypothetical protein